MPAAPDNNFSGRLVNRLGEHSCLIDATTNEIIPTSGLRHLIISFAVSLLSAGLRPRDRILVGCTLSPASSIAYLAAMYAGIVPIPVERRTLLESSASLVEDTGARAVWAEESLQSASLSQGGVLAFHGIPEQQYDVECPPASCDENDIAALFTTSGSTGKPRFVMVSHGNLVANTEAIIRSQSLSHDERAMLILPMSYCFGASVLQTHLYQGGSVVFDRRFMFPDKVLRAIREYACTTFAGVPTVYNILLRRSNIRSISMPTLRRFLQAGGPLARRCVTEIRDTVPNAKFYVMYGQTEATSRISCLDAERLDDKLGSVGRPLDNLTVRIIDEEGRDLPVGTVGEITAKGPSITSGYFNQPEESREVFRQGWLRTGDLGHLDEEGYLWVDGRIGAFLKMRGVRVSFAEVEARIAAVPGVFECAAAAVPHPEAGEALALYIVPDQKGEEVIERVRYGLPSSWTCSCIQIVSAIPKTERGKVARASLPAMAIGAHD